MEIADLSTGCMELIMNGIEYEKPVLQILGSKILSTAKKEDRLRLLVSDGKYLNSCALLATQLMHLHTQGKLVENTVVRVERYITTMVNKSEKGDKRIFIILDLTILNLGTEVGKKLGDPVLLDSGENPIAPSTSTSTFLNTDPSNHATGSAQPMETSSNRLTKSTMMSSQLLRNCLTYPIATLSPYQNKWTIKALVASKSHIKTWSNARGEGKYFNMDLMDESGEIRATAFKEQVDKFYKMIEVDKVYFISKCQLKPANKRYNALNNDYEITFTIETNVQLCEDTISIPQVHYNFVPISQIANMETNAFVDIIGVCHEIGDIQVVVGRKDGKEHNKRDITLIDSSKASITLTLWRDEADKFNCDAKSIILVKGARITEFGGGKCLSCNGTLKINPDIAEGHKLREWFNNGGGENSFVSVSGRTSLGNIDADWTTFYEAQMKSFGCDDKPICFQTRGYIHVIRQKNSVYKACPNCRKKVIDEENGCYRCERCNSCLPNFEYGLCAKMCIGDWTSSRWAVCFNDVGEQIFGCSTQEIGLALENDSERAEEIFSTLIFKSYIFKLRIQVEMLDGSPHREFIVMNATKLNHKEYNQYLIQNLQELTGIGKL